MFLPLAFFSTKHAGRLEVLLILLCLSSMATADIELSPGYNSSLVYAQVQYLLDKDASQTPETIVHADFTQGQAGGSLSRFRDLPYPVWIRLDVQNPTAERGSWTLTVPANLFADIYHQDGHQTGQALTLKARHSEQEFVNGTTYLDLGLSSVFTLDSGQSTRFYILLAPGQIRYIDIDFIDSTQVSTVNLKMISMLAIIGAIISVLCIVNIAHFLVLKRTVFFYYVLTQLCVLTAWIAFNGAGLRFIWPDMPGIDNNVIAAAFFFGDACAVLFLRAFFGTGKVIPNYDRGLLAIALPGFLLGGVALFDLSLVGDWYRFYTLLCTATCFAGGGYFYRKGNPSAIFYLCGWGMVFTTFMVTLLLRSQGVQISIIDLFGVTMAMEAFVMFFALTHQVSLIRKAHDRQQQEMVTLYQARADEAQTLLMAEKERLVLLSKYQHQLEHVASISHDMVQPLQSLKMTIKAMALTEPEMDCLDNLDNAVSFLDSLVHKVMLDARTEYNAQRIDVTLGDVFREATELYLLEARQSNIKLKYFDSQLQLEASRVIIQRIVNNLLSNAIAHSQAQHILLGCRRQGRDLCIQVIDNGRGLGAQEVKRLSSPFVASEEIEGHYGLGLAIVKRLCQESGYSFHITSNTEKGSCFSILVPLTD